MFYDATPDTFEKPRWLRHNPTKHERLLWENLRKKKVLGFRFRRQHPIGDYIADFYCHTLKLVVEVDGVSHMKLEQKFNDSQRTADLHRLGLTVMRFTNREIEDDLEAVMHEIVRYITEKISKT
jgi:very-short-patch-repair endonuclease